MLAVPGRRKASILFGVRRIVEARQVAMIKRTGRSNLPVLMSNFPEQITRKALRRKTNKLPKTKTANLLTTKMLGEMGRVVMGTRKMMAQRMYVSILVRILFMVSLRSSPPSEESDSTSASQTCLRSLPLRRRFTELLLCPVCLFLYNLSRLFSLKVTFSIQQYVLRYRMIQYRVKDVEEIWGIREIREMQKLKTTVGFPFCIKLFRQATFNAMFLFQRNNQLVD